MNPPQHQPIDRPRRGQQTEHIESSAPVPNDDDLEELEPEDPTVEVDGEYLDYLLNISAICDYPGDFACELLKLEIPSLSFFESLARLRIALFNLENSERISKPGVEEISRFFSLFVTSQRTVPPSF
jgi:hypothetical protein